MFSYDRPIRKITQAPGAVMLRPSLQHQKQQLDAQVAAEAAYARQLHLDLPQITWTEALRVAARVIAQDPQFRP